jgi:hypothetical protein
MEVGEVFRRIFAPLAASNIPYMLVGSFASSYYGALRSTQDIDIVISATPEQLRQLVQLLQPMDYYADIGAALDALKNHSMFNVLDNKTGWKIDFIFRKPTPFGREGLHRRQSVQFQGVELFIASPEDLVVSKLEWAKMGGSQLQIRDVATVLKKRWASLDHSYLKKWVAELDLAAEWQSALQQAGIQPG